MWLLVVVRWARDHLSGQVEYPLSSAFHGYRSELPPLFQTPHFGLLLDLFFLVVVIYGKLSRTNLSLVFIHKPLQK